MCLGMIGPRQINCNAATSKKKKKKKERFFNSKLNVRTGFLDPENMGKGPKIDFLSQILRKLWGTEYLAHLTEKLLKGDGVEVM